MGAPLAVAVAVKEAGVVVAAAAVVGTFFLGAARARACAALLALAITPVLLVGELWNTHQVHQVRDRPVAAAAAAVLGLVLIPALAALFLRRPSLLPLLAVGALPFRIPVAAGGQTANLLVPLYVVVGAGVLAYAWERLRPTDAATDGGSRGYAFAGSERAAGYLEGALLLYVGLYAVQSAYSSDFEQALKNIAFFYIPFALLLRLLTSIDWTRRLGARCFGVVLALAGLFVAIGFLEYQTRHLLWNPKVIESNQFESYFRVNSLFFDPNIYGRFLAMVMIALAAGLLWSVRRRTAVLVAAALAFLWAGLVLSFSQSSFAALLVGLALLAALRWRPRLVLAAGAVALAAAVVVIVAAPSLIKLRSGSHRSLNQATSGRLDLMRGGLRMFASRPLAGYGSGSFAARFRAREGASSERAASASHTIPITVAAEQGVIGLAAYALVLVAAFGLLLRGLGPLRGRDPPPAGLVPRAFTAAAFTALVFHTLLYAAFLEDPITWTLMGVGIGLARRPPRARRPRAESDDGAGARGQAPVAPKAPPQRA